MLLRLWSQHPYRATRDLDLLRRGVGPHEAIQADLDVICRTEVEPDGVTFEAESIRLEPIRREDEYAGTRARLVARCGTIRTTLLRAGWSRWRPSSPGSLLRPWRAGRVRKSRARGARFDPSEGRRPADHDPGRLPGGRRPQRSSRLKNGDTLRRRRPWTGEDAAKKKTAVMAWVGAKLEADPRLARAGPRSSAG